MKINDTYFINIDNAKTITTNLLDADRVDTYTITDNEYFKVNRIAYLISKKTFNNNQKNAGLRRIYEQLFHFDESAVEARLMNVSVEEKETFGCRWSVSFFINKRYNIIVSKFNESITYIETNLYSNDLSLVGYSIDSEEFPKLLSVYNCLAGSFDIATRNTMLRQCYSNMGFTEAPIEDRLFKLSSANDR